MQEKMHRICCLETKHAGGKTKEERREEIRREEDENGFREYKLQ